MLELRSVYKVRIVSIFSAIVIAALPVPAIAADAATPPVTPAADQTASPVTNSSPAPSTDTPAPTTNNQTTPPADPNKYSYDASTGLWGNGTYTWNPKTNQSQPVSQPDYSYNPTTSHWDTSQWQYDPNSGKYQANVAPAAANNPAAATDTSAASGTDPNNPSATNQSNAPDSNSNNPLGASLLNNEPNGLNQTGPGSNNSSGNHSTANHIYDLFYNASISNNIISQARTGDANILGNTVAGNAVTGAASTMSNLINLLNSSWNPVGSNLVTFVKNIFGNVVGDLLIDPGQIKSQSGAASNPQNSNLTVNAQGSGQINNNVDLSANSGNATVAQNTKAGSATTGDANAVADVVNMINSVIGANQSFLGMINIYGSLTGDILMPQNMLTNLLASNAPRATINTSNLDNSSVLAQFNNTQAINNNVNANAASGQANVTGNTSAGNATTGNADTNVTVLNLTGHQVVGANSLLVFVNVLGQWVGLIMDAPNGSTAAALGGGITQDNIMNGNQNTTINSSSNDQINNNINVNAGSGDATVARNTIGGDATTGNASASVNLANMLNSQLNLSNWFGVLFINVFGSWHGSFGIDTPYGNPVANNTQGSGTSTINGGNVKVFRFVPHSGSGGNTTMHVTPVDANSVGLDGSNASNNRLAATVASINNGNNSTGSTNKGNPHHVNMLPLVGGIMGLTFLSGEQLYSLRQKRHNKIV